MTDTKFISVTAVPDNYHWSRSAIFLTGQAALFGFGILADSSAMQWASFILIVAGALLALIKHIDQKMAVSIDEARAKLDQIEAAEKAKADT